MRRITATLALLAVVGSACGGGAADTTTTEQATTTAPEQTTTVGDTTTSTEAAEVEPGSLVVYSGRSEDLVAPLLEQFEAETGIGVEVLYDGTGALATRLLEEGARSPADVFWAQDPAFIGAVAKDGLLRRLPEEVISLVPERFSDGEGRWVGVSGRTRVLVYHPDLVSGDELPESVSDLVDPAWQGRLGVAPTNGSFVAFVAAMILVEGEERTLGWLRGIAANDPVAFEGNSPIVAAVDAGEVASGLVNHYYLLRIQEEQGSSTAVNHFFGGDDLGALVLATGAGILESAENPDEAEELIRFLLGESAQRYFLEEILEYPLIEGIGTPAGQVPLEELPTPDVDLSDLADTLDRATDLISEAGLT